MSTYVLTETLFFFLLLSSLLASLRAIESGDRGRFAVAGALWGLSALVRPTTLFIVPIAVLAVLVYGRLKPWRPHALALLLGFALALSPWWARNALLPPRQMESSKLVNFLLHGSYPDFTYDHDPGSYGDPYRHDPHAAEYGRSVPAALAHIAQDFRDDPLTNLRWYLIGKPGYFLSWSNIDGVGDIFVYDVATSPYFNNRFFDLTRRIMFVLHWPLMLIGFGGCLFVWWRPERIGLGGRALVPARVVSVVFLYALGLHMVGAPFPRYGIPFRPLLFPMALLVVTGFTKEPTEPKSHGRSAGY